MAYRLFSSLLAALSLGLSVPSASAEMPAQPAETASRGVYENIELGFKLCTNHILQRGHLAPADDAMLRLLDVKLLTEVPVEIDAMSNRVFPVNRVFALLGGNEGNVYVTTAKDRLLCQVIVADSLDALAGRARFVESLQKISVWTYHAEHSGVVDGIRRDELSIAGGRLVTLIQGPEAVLNEGRGVQATVTVAIVPPTS